MDEPSLLELFVRPLVTSGIPYFITGGVATIIYGEPRFTRESERSLHGHFNLVHLESGLVADCYVAGDDPPHALAFSHRRALTVNGLEIQVAPVEYVIARKLSYFAQSGSTRHLEDVVRICRVQGELIDQGALIHMVHMLDVSDAWQRVTTMLEPT